jgi:hypothetical protein
MASPEESSAIEFQLCQELEIAREWYERARSEKQRNVSEMPSTIPSPDGAARIKIAGDWERFARNTYSVGGELVKVPVFSR